jgi:hypothetical protein
MPRSHRHTYLFREGLWTARGVYYDAERVEKICEGESRISHQPEVWINDGYLRIMSDPPQEFTNKYEVVPFEPGSDVTTWKSVNPNLDDLRGLFVVVYDSINSPWESQNGEYWGNEFLVQVTENVYRNRGFAFHRDRKLSSWAVELTYKG